MACHEIVPSVSEKGRAILLAAPFPRVWMKSCNTSCVRQKIYIVNIAYHISFAVARFRFFRRYSVHISCFRPTPHPSTRKHGDAREHIAVVRTREEDKKKVPNCHILIDTHTHTHTHSRKRRMMATRSRRWEHRTIHTVTAWRGRAGVLALQSYYITRAPVRTPCPCYGSAVHCSTVRNTMTERQPRIGIDFTVLWSVRRVHAARFECITTYRKWIIFTCHFKHLAEFSYLEKVRNNPIRHTHAVHLSNRCPKLRNLRAVITITVSSRHSPSLIFCSAFFTHSKFIL